MDATVHKALESEAIREALRKAAQAEEAPDVEALRDGVVLAGIPCRLTLGAIVLLQASDCALLGGNGPADERAALAVLYATSDDTRAEAGATVDDPAAWAAGIDRMARAMSRAGLVRVAAAVCEWWERIGATIGSMEGGDGPTRRRRPRWWADVVDTLAHEYGWADAYILWELPYVRALAYCESISARRTGKPVASGGGKGTREALDRIERELAAIREHDGWQSET
ncbi:MAG TPA: hypothetical protein VM487_11130 [Phycisphaerae bacterium]|nr:hypothetical protein [Phycisphaerae bacterium]